MKQHDNELIRTLDQLSHQEHQVADYFKRATEEAERRKRHEAILFRAFQEDHVARALRLNEIKERFDHENGETMFGKAWESFIEAVRSLTAGLPVSFIEGETNPTINFLVELEEGLIDGYDRVRETTDGPLKVFLGQAIANSERHVSRLRELQTESV